MRRGDVRGWKKNYKTILRTRLSRPWSDMESSFSCSLLLTNLLEPSGLNIVQLPFTADRAEWAQVGGSDWLSPVTSPWDGIWGWSHLKTNQSGRESHAVRPATPSCLNRTGAGGDLARTRLPLQGRRRERVAWREIHWERQGGLHRGVLRAGDWADG